MEYGFLAIMIVLFCCLLWNIWGLKCNNTTYNQRSSYLAIRSLDNENNRNLYYSMSEKDRVEWLLEWKIIMDGFDAVSYDQHAKAVLWFKDPLNLYPEDFRKLVQNQTTGG